MPLPTIPISSESNSLQVVNCALHDETEKLFSQGLTSYSLPGYESGEPNEDLRAALPDLDLANTSAKRSRLLRTGQSNEKQWPTSLNTSGGRLLFVLL